MNSDLETTTVEVPQGMAGSRLDAGLAQLLPQHSRTRIRNWIEQGFAQVDGRVKLYLGLDGWFGKQDPSQWIEEYVTLILRHRPQAEFGEGGVIQRAVEPFLNRRRLERKAHGRVEWLQSITDKQARASSLRAMASMGLVGLPDNDYGQRLLHQLLSFPAGKYDDAVDMLAMLPRALDMAHPALGKAPPPAVKIGRWDRAFAKSDESEMCWS